MIPSIKKILKISQTPQRNVIIWHFIKKEKKRIEKIPITLCILKIVAGIAVSC